MNSQHNIDLEVADLMGDIETMADGNALGCYACCGSASSFWGGACASSTSSYSYC